MKLPAASDVRRSPGRRTTVVVISSMSAGPVSSAPDPMSVPSKTFASTQPWPGNQTDRCSSGDGAPEAGLVADSEDAPVEAEAIMRSEAMRIVPSFCT